MRDESGAVVGILDTTVEQTARTRSEQALQASEQRNRHIVESISDGLIRLDRDGRIVEDSTSWRAFTGQTVEEWRGDGW